MCLKQGKISENWLKAKVVPIFKKGGGNNCENYSCIILLDNEYKIYSRIIIIRLMVIAKNVIDEEQMGFRNGRSKIDAIFLLR